MRMILQAAAILCLTRLMERKNRRRPGQLNGWSIPVQKSDWFILILPRHLEMQNISVSFLLHFQRSIISLQMCRFTRNRTFSGATNWLLSKLVVHCSFYDRSKCVANFCSITYNRWTNKRTDISFQKFFSDDIVVANQKYVFRSKSIYFNHSVL